MPSEDRTMLIHLGLFRKRSCMIPHVERSLHLVLYPRASQRCKWKSSQTTRYTPIGAPRFWPRQQPMWQGLLTTTNDGMWNLTPGELRSESKCE